MNQQVYYLIGYVAVLTCLTTLVLTNHVPADTLVGAVALILGHIGGVYTPPPNQTKGTNTNAS